MTRVPGGPAKLIAHELLSFAMTRRDEWGPSIYVNGAQTEANRPGEIELSIEMQSGDQIVVVTRRLEVS